MFKCNSIGKGSSSDCERGRGQGGAPAVLAVTLGSFVSEVGELALVPSPPPRRCVGDVMTDLQCFLVCMVTDVYVNNRLFYEGIHFIAKY